MSTPETFGNLPDIKTTDFIEVEVAAADPMGFGTTGITTSREYPMQCRTLATTPLQVIETEPASPDVLTHDVVGPNGLQLLRDLRRAPEDRSSIDGFMAVNAKPLDGNTFDKLGQEWQAAKARGENVVGFFLRTTDMSHAALPVRNMHSGESFASYMDHMDASLRRRGGHPFGIPLPNLVDAPGMRFTDGFLVDSAMVSMGRCAIGNIEGALAPLDNSMYLSYRYDGMIPNFSSELSLFPARSQSPVTSYAVERVAAAYGKDGDEVIAHYHEPLAINLSFWMRGRERLQSIEHDHGAVSGRQILLPGSGHDIVFRFSGDVKANLATMQGIRPESAAEDEELALKILGNLQGREREVAFQKFTEDILGAAESEQDMADWQLSDYKSLEKIRTSDIAPAYLQAHTIHLMRMVGNFEEADKLAGTLNRRFWRDIDDTHGQYTDVLYDGTQTMALHAAQAYPLLVGGIVPYDRAIKIANTWRDVLLRENGFIISAGSSDQQWSGNPIPTGNSQNDDLLRHIQTSMYGELVEEGGVDRAWPSACAMLVEAFTMAAIEAKANGYDAEPLYEVAEMARDGTVKGIMAAAEHFRYIGEKFCASDPKQFVNGGEYGHTPETAQRGFGMTIGAFRMLAGRNLRGEINNPREYSWRQFTLRRSLGGLLVARQTF